MKIRLTLLFLVIAGLGFAQKKEIKKMEKLVSQGDFKQAIEIFETINKAEVEQEYLAEYTFYEAASFLNLDGTKMPTAEDFFKATAALKKSKELGFDNQQFIPVLENIITQGEYAFLQNLVANKKLDEAYKFVEFLYNEDKSDLDMLYNLANLGYQTQNYDQARNYYTKLWDKRYLAENVTYFAINKENLLLEEFVSKEVRDLSVSSKSHDNPSETVTTQLGVIISNLVWLYKEDGDIEKAKQILTKAVADYPNDVSLNAVKPGNFISLGMTEEYENATGVNSKSISDPKVYDDLGRSALNSKNYTQAILYYENSLSIEPNNFDSQANLGFACIEKGNVSTTEEKERQVLYKKSIEAYKAAHEIKPDNKIVINALVNLYTAFSMTDEAALMKAKL